MNFDFADILLKVVEHKASDLHITSGRTADDPRPRLAGPARGACRT